MTIDRGYLEIWKEIAPHAFTAELPFEPTTAFLDGQLHLMRASFMNTWEVFLDVQFVNPLNRLFRWGATTVVLSFDNYKLTPTAKQPTQRRRTTKIPKLEWNEQVCLPSRIPDNYEQLIMNRVFKARVCQHVVANVPGLLDLRNGRRLIVDYNDGSLEFTEGCTEPTRIFQQHELGESDVKFAAYMTDSDSFLADSIDGDYVVIAAMQLEKTKQMGGKIPNVAVRRIAMQPKPQKRLITGAVVPHRTRQYEFVHINLLVESLQRWVASHCMLGKDFIGHEIRLISFLVALVGCDFTNGLPRVGPKTVWQKLPIIWKPLQKAFNHDKNEFCVADVGNGVLTTLLCAINRKHVHGHTQSLEQLVTSLRTSPTLQPSIKQKVPTVHELACLVRNSNWVLHYWWDASLPPREASKHYGFVQNRNGNTERDSNSALKDAETELLHMSGDENSSEET
jgi:hypothetical protein